MIEYENLAKVNEKLFSQYKSKFDHFLEKGWYVLGEQVAAFEKEFADFCQVESCVGVASGLDALILAIDALNLPKGSEIIVPSNTYIATILAIVRNGFSPVLVEPDIQTYNIDPEKISESISNKTKVILVVHLYGKACNMQPIMELAKSNGLIVIEDAAQAHGAAYRGQKVGSFGIGCFSFYPTKNLGALGDAGAVTLNDCSLEKRLRLLRNYGSEIKYYNEEVGYNSRLDEIQAGFLREKLSILDEITEHKRKLASIYFNKLSDAFIKPLVDDDYYDVYHIFNIRHQNRDSLRKYLLENDIKTEVHYPIAPHKQKAMQGIIEGDYPISEEIHATTLSLPISYYHTEKDVERVCEVMNNWA